MSASSWAGYDASAAAETRDAIHAYAKILGACLKACRSKRKHWWHASLRPSLNGITTGIVRASTDFEIELDFRDASLRGRSQEENAFKLELAGQSVRDIAQIVGRFLVANQVDDSRVEQFVQNQWDAEAFENFDADYACQMGQVLNSVATSLEKFRAGIREETSPIQVWPHHFDMSMIWLPGDRIPGQDPQDEENADKQMNFGFAFGDSSISEPYFYVTTYPALQGVSSLRLPKGTDWVENGFSGAVLTYATLLEAEDPGAYLQDLWTLLLEAGRKEMSGTPG